VQAGTGWLTGDDDAVSGKSADARPDAAGLGKSFVLDLRSRGVRSVRDAVFLHGYAEPVLLILHEAAPTWAGRLALRHDTCALDAFSVGLASNQATRIWGDTRLPYDCTQLVAVPPPSGGCLVLGAAFLLYRAQGAPPVSLALHPLSCGTPEVPSNEIGDDGRPLAPPSGAASVNPPPAVAAHATLSSITTSLEGARVAFPPEGGGALVATQQGTLLGLHLRTSGRTVTQLELSTTGTSHGRVAVKWPSPSALCVTGMGLLFAASRNGDAVLTEYVYVPPRAVTLSLEAAAPAAKKPRIDVQAAAAQPLDGMDDEDALLYGNADTTVQIDKVPSAAAEDAAAVAASALAATPVGASTQGLLPVLPPGGTYTTGLADTLLCQAPVVAMAVGEAPLVGDTNPVDGTNTRPELLLGCGAGAHGSLVAAHRGVVLDLVASVPLPGVRGAWALHARKAGLPASTSADTLATAPGGSRVHDFLVISTATGTMILDASSSDELSEVSDKAEFETGAPTVGAGALFGGARLVQVHPTGIRLCAGLVKAQDLALSGLAPPAPGSVTVAAADVAHPYVLLRLSDGTLRLLAGNPATNRVEAVPPKAGANKRALLARPEFAAATLYDDAAGNGALAALIGGGARAAAQHYVVAATLTGNVEIYSLPAQACVFTSDGFAAGMHLLCSSPAARAACSAIDTVHPGEDTPEAPKIADVRLDAFPWDASHDAPLLTAVRSDGDIICWRAFAAPAHVTPEARRAGAGATELRFVRYAIDSMAPPPGRTAPAPGDLDALPRLLVPLVGVRGGAGAQGSVNGVMVLGETPLILVTHRGSVRAHPLRLPAGASGIAAATPFHNVNCPHGVVVATPGAGGGALRIASLPPGVDLTTPWPSTLFKLACTPVALAYASEARCYAAVVSVRRPFRARTVEPGDMHGETAARLAAAAAELRGGMEDAHEVRLLAQGSLASQWVFPLDPGEVGLALVPMPVRNGATGETVQALCVGTGVLAGEDAPCRGRVLLITVSWTPTHDANAAAQMAVARTGRVLVDRSFKSAVTAAAPLEGQYRGYILLAVGTKLGVHVWNGGSDVTCVAFFDTPAYSVSLASVRNFALLGDVHKGLFFLRWKDSPTDRVLALLAKTFERLDFAAGEFITDGNTLSLLGADTLGVLHVYAFTPGAVEAWMGQKLLPRARFHTGRGICQALCMRTPGLQAVQRTGVLLSSLEGAMSAVTPLDEALFTNLRALEGAMVLGLPHHAGLNPAAFRAPRERQGRVGKQSCSGTLVDCTLLRRFLGAPWAAQHALAEAAGHPRAALVAAALTAQAGSQWFS